ncbi:hypothetical protein M409DRAFT_70672 [Zasmidium cellare ATCC 36951]|uniref:Uncharacterized protein n=1 Tax=Zasmidium cellare ATCC 36951 TaxID=1080233 RepID=A0A6A6C2R8_ZASCE|nr:uncharacterized protein M409DRAFT_70672 [Zasmidium cellare ATCC 36951]KAF2160162.1 hypothetical protein M409DRAFT_70672 [Zasmidium cellare ATCC 36951]
MSTPLVFLITGASNGLGLSLAKTILAAGHKVVATMRNPSKAPSGLDSPNCAKITLDVTSPTLEQDLQPCIAAFGHIDVLINNAGYGYGGPLEDCDFDAARKMVETLFWGPMRLTKALIPHFRSLGHGHIINITSTEGIGGQPALSFYAASKHALEGASESLAGELAPFNIRVLIVQPGGMRTGFMEPGRMSAASISSHYENSPADWVMGAIRGMDGNQNLDPDRCAKRILEAVVGGGVGWPEGGIGEFLRLPLGNEFLGRFEGKMEMVRRNVDALERVARSCDFE